MHGQTAAEVGCGRRRGLPRTALFVAFAEAYAGSTGLKLASGKFRWLSYGDGRLIRSLGASKRAFNYFRSRWLQSPDGRMWGAAPVDGAPEAEAEAAPGVRLDGCRSLRGTWHPFLR